MADHEDYLPGELPAIHSPTHANGGVDELNVAGLSGVTQELGIHAALPTVHQDAPALIATHTAIAAAHHARYTDGEAQDVADAQIATHAALPTVHQDAPALILTHKGDASAHHARYTDGEAVTQADARIAIHSALPTVHQDAPALILTHKGDASAHHAKYTDAEARSLFSPISYGPSAFTPERDFYDWVQDGQTLTNRTILTAQNYHNNVIAPNGSIITKITLYGYRDDADAALQLLLVKIDRIAGSVLMASVVADWTTGYDSGYVDYINFATIDNNNYSYDLIVVLNPNDNVADVKFSGAMIDFT
uniref:Uncharacterized protein n=1 Tax=viral metagenome TaxID=1070528 RepID=A0A6M3MEM6_9ZZZZ